MDRQDGSACAAIISSTAAWARSPSPGLRSAAHQLRQAVALDRGSGALVSAIRRSSRSSKLWLRQGHGRGFRHSMGSARPGTRGRRRGRARRRSSPAGPRRPGPRRRHRGGHHMLVRPDQPELRRPSPRPAGAAAPRGPSASQWAPTATRRSRAPSSVGSWTGGTWSLKTRAVNQGPSSWCSERCARRSSTTLGSARPACGLAGCASGDGGDGRHAEPAGIDHARGHVVARGQGDDGIAPHARRFGRAGMHEARRAPRLADVLQRRVLALGAVAVEQGVAGASCSTSASFQPRLSASWMPPLPPRAPNGATRCAESPANSTRPWRRPDRHSWR